MDTPPSPSPSTVVFYEKLLSGGKERREVCLGFILLTASKPTAVKN